MKEELLAYATVGFEICNSVPPDALRDFLDQLTLGHRLGWDLVILGGELSHVR